MFINIADIPVDLTPALKGTALAGFREAIGNWQRVAGFEAGQTGNRAELAFSRHVAEEIDNLGKSKFKAGDLKAIQERYAGPGCDVLTRRELDPAQMQASEAFVLLGAERLATIFQQAQIINQDQLPAYLAASRSALETPPQNAEQIERETVGFIENAGHYMFRTHEGSNPINVFGPVAIEAQCVRAMQHFCAQHPELDSDQLRQEFWTYLTRTATARSLPVHAAFLYQPQFFTDLMPLARQTTLQRRDSLSF